MKKRKWTLLSFILITAMILFCIWQINHKGSFPILKLFSLLVTCSHIFIKAIEEHKNRNIEKKLKEENGLIEKILGKHIRGLELSKEECELYFFTDNLKLVEENFYFVVPIERIKNIFWTTKKELDTMYLSHNGELKGAKVYWSPYDLIDEVGNGKAKKVPEYLFIIVYKRIQSEGYNYIVIDVTKDWKLVQNILETDWII